ncbi:hypothetical protein AWZ03_001144 [Drosophila navojoa]|uniref:G-protein coupled receptors family 2 profile 2 domain-containing protein n=1 Tax=Drosophila navojoa TaxID=7232 RepID=A0A484BUI4_DRONA|nr:adhesion G-protein coupled receptor G6-like [Drosophila navojoa]TDG52314.1 hypothetical protein AWZ03_001144 [Drosophila navojoa]
MIWQLCLILAALGPSLAHVRLAPSTTERSVQLFPQQQWQLRSHSSTVKPAQSVFYMKLLPVAHCEPEDFQHNYKVLSATGEVTFEPHLNHFGRTRAGGWASMRDLCLDEQGLPWRRLCNASAEWATLGSVNCSAGSQLSRQLNQLREDVQSRSSTAVALSKLRHLLTEARGQLAPVDVYSTAQIFAELLEQQQPTGAVSADLVGICREIMSSDEQVLRLSAEVNATNSLLSKFEDYMDALPPQLVPSESCGKTRAEADKSTEKGVQAVNYAQLGVQALMSSNLSVFYVNPECENITGIAIYAAGAADRMSASSGFWYRFLYANESLEQLRAERDLQTGTYLPTQLWEQLSQRGASYLVLKVYAHDGLFVERAQQRSPKPRSQVLSISIPGFEGAQLPAPLPFLLPRVGVSGKDSRCGYWNYGSWLSDGVSTCGGHNEEPNVLCEAQHLTQFSFLIGGSFTQHSAEASDVLLEAAHEQLLDLITQVGCGLSLFGLLFIFLTAALVEKWRSQASTKVLLHLCLALALQLLLFGYLGAEQLHLKQSWNRCLISGAALQYSVLVIFSWMLIIAFLQFQRYVTVIGVARPSHYILISALVAWTLPLLPTFLVVLLDADSFQPSQHQLKGNAALCYPSGYGLALGVVLPIGLVTFANAFMMLCIIYSIHRALNPRRQLIIQQLRLSVLLFFLLGLTWIFGLCSYMRLGIIFSYLFCLSATLQGFVLFVYFVLLNASNRHAWLSLICSRQMKINMPNAERQSMSTSSSNTSRRTQSSVKSI